MAVKLKWPWLGIAIPCLLISFLAYCSHFFILSRILTLYHQLWFEFSVSMIWISYYLAIYTNPGRPVRSFHPSKDEWSNFCTKCNCFKPERAHHCKTCNQCVLMMDHHCPWTMNCVGYKNYPHFIRFLFWVIVTTSYLNYHLFHRIAYIWQNHTLPGYLFTTSEIVFLTLVTPLNTFVLLTIVILFCRCVTNQIVNGRTQIESWEMDRLEGQFTSNRLLPQLIENLWKLHPEDKNEEAKIEADKLLATKKLRFESVVTFPYDIGFFGNAVTVLGPPAKWLWIFGCPNGSGMDFIKDELATYEKDSNIQDKLLSLPWPPDSGRSNTVSNENLGSGVELLVEDGEHLVRSRSRDRHFRITPRKQWTNDWGETLEDFGVDLKTELN